MAFNGSGVFNRLYSWANDALNSIPISSTRMDAETNGIAAGLTNCVTRDGQSPATANLPMGGFRHTNAGPGVAETDYATLGQVRNSTFRWGGTAGGTGNAITITLNPVPTGYVAGMHIAFLASAANSGAATINISGLGAKNIFSRGAALAGGELAINDLVTLTYDGTQFQLEDQAFPASKDLPMVSFKFTQVGNAAARDQFPSVAQLQDNTLLRGTVGGTANAITLTLTPAITAYVTGQLFSLIPTADNTSATTINVNGVGVVNVFSSGVAMVGGELKNGVPALIEYDGTRFSLIGGGASASVRAANGSKSAPSISFLNDTQHGWYRQASGNIRWTGGNVDKIAVTSSAVDIYAGTGGAEVSNFQVNASGTRIMLEDEGSAPNGIGMRSATNANWGFSTNGSTRLSLYCGSSSARYIALASNFSFNTDNSASSGFTGVRWSVVYAATGTINTSDEREKTDIHDIELGLDFVNALQPKTFRWIEGRKNVDEDGVVTSVPGRRRHAGLIAQQVKEQLDARGVDIALWTVDDKDDPNSRQGLRYDQMIPILVKAVQQLSARVGALETGS